MKVARIVPPGATEIVVGIVDATQGQILDATQVVRQLGLPVDASRAVELLRYNTETEGALSRSLKDLSPLQATRWPANSVVYHPPVEAGSLRDFFAYEEHVAAGRRRRGLEIPEAWFRIPVYYKGNHRTLIGHQQELHWPRFTEQLDYELELACIIGRQGINVPLEEATNYIGGYCIMNDWSARDIQMYESSVGLGPAKGKDFATSLGPWVVTPDEFDMASARAIARIDGQVWTDSKTSGIKWSFAQMIAHVSMDEAIYPGDVFGSGTVGGGCGLENGHWLEPGHQVGLEITGLGVLSNGVVRLSRPQNPPPFPRVVW